MNLSQISELAVAGFAIGCIYALIALGFTMIIRTTGVLHFAQGEVVMLGAMAGLTALQFAQLPFIVVLLVGMLFGGLVAVVVEVTVYRWLNYRKAPLANVIIATVGVSIVLQNVARLVWGSEARAYPKLFEVDTYTLGSAHIPPQLIWIIVLGAMVMIVLQLFLSKTQTGRALQACAQDADAAYLMGIDVRRMTTYTYGIAGLLGGGAGVLLGSMFYASFGMGFIVGIKAFVAATVGGLGSIGGAVLGGLVFGLVETATSVVISSAYRDAIGMILLILILLVSPGGLAGLRRPQR
ncbi:branched-chain amino acid ABC transporter permease [Polaromonas sp. JS666]|uniref:branched-chain amino acid ABC transporter permease n=1 Tax=Polaromonas sp. (strain JS666 / ATCC BAA-500) TaxID=296591 RepID=UPI0000D5B34F|nr:branched-chain amino acid ABC transporter permease [Polaromonas sp. JS666]ABE42317.1 amino acid/amide ABC transporter membrane protein 1, HAAT family [Polaromonas sp. JS666]